MLCLLLIAVSVNDFGPPPPLPELTPITLPLDGGRYAVLTKVMDSVTYDKFPTLTYLKDSSRFGEPPLAKKTLFGCSSLLSWGYFRNGRDYVLLFEADRTIFMTKVSRSGSVETAKLELHHQSIVKEYTRRGATIIEFCYTGCPCLKRHRLEYKGTDDELQVEWRWNQASKSWTHRIREQQD